MKEYFLRLFHHADWANRRALALLQKISEPPEKARRVFAHLLAAEQVWLTRMRGEDSSALEIWPDQTLDKCALMVEKNAADYRRYLTTVSEETLNAVMIYRNSKGLEFRNTISDTLTHVAMHGSYHRGQIAQTVRNAGHEPVNTDFITFVRETA
jgi:uncharacterized damage-inducible protein DinB